MNRLQATEGGDRSEMIVLGLKSIVSCIEDGLAKKIF